jgi:predicted S18 family serine protease
LKNLKQQRRRDKDASSNKEPKATKKYTTADYDNFRKNYGFGQNFLPYEAETKVEKLEKYRKRGEYARSIKERNAINVIYSDPHDPQNPQNITARMNENVKRINYLQIQPISNINKQNNIRNSNKVR